MNKLKDDTTPKICVNLTGSSQIEDISTHLPTNNQTIIAQYINKEQPYLQAIFTEEDSMSTNKH